MDYSSYEMRKKGVESLKGNWGLAIVVWFFTFVITFFGADIYSYLKGFSEATGDVLQTYKIVFGESFIAGCVSFYHKYYTPLLIIYLATNLFTLILGFGQRKLYINFIRHKEERFSTIFEGFTYVPKLIFSTIVYVIVVIIGFMCLIIPGIVLGLRYAMVQYIIADDNEISIIDAFDYSKEMMEGHKKDYFWLIISLLPYAILNMLTMGLAGMYTDPIMNSAQAQFYSCVKADYDKLLEGEE